MRPARPASRPAAVPGGATQNVEDVLARPGQPLDAATRGLLEPRFGVDFSGVRVHADDAAGRSAASLRARAYTVGSHVVFGAGEYAPETPVGRTLLAHELTHTIQQGGSAPVHGMPGAVRTSRTGGRRVQGGFWDDVWSGIQTVGRAIGSAFGWVGDRIVDAANWAADLLRELPARLLRLGQTLLDGFVGVLTFIPDAIRALASGGLSGLGDFLWNRALSAGGWLLTLVSRVFDVLSGPEAIEFITHLVTRATPLTGPEIAAAQSVLGPSAIRWDRVRVAESGILSIVFSLNQGQGVRDLPHDQPAEHRCARTQQSGDRRARADACVPVRADGFAVSRSGDPRAGHDRLRLRRGRRAAPRPRRRSALPRLQPRAAGADRAGLLRTAPDARRHGGLRRVHRGTAGGGISRAARRAAEHHAPDASNDQASGKLAGCSCGSAASIRASSVRRLAARSMPASGSMLPAKRRSRSCQSSGPSTRTASGKHHGLPGGRAAAGTGPRTRRPHRRDGPGVTGSSSRRCSSASDRLPERCRDRAANRPRPATPSASAAASGGRTGRLPSGREPGRGRRRDTRGWSRGARRGSKCRADRGWSWRTPQRIDDDADRRVLRPQDVERSRHSGPHRAVSGHTARGAVRRAASSTASLSPAGSRISTARWWTLMSPCCARPDMIRLTVSILSPR
jgi:hypothetical protein